MAPLIRQVPLPRIRSPLALALAVALAACGVGGIDSTQVSPISNDDTFYTLGYLWSGARSAIEGRLEPTTDTFNLALSFKLACPRSGQRSYQGTLAGTKTGGAGTATLSMTATLTACQFNDNKTITEITASAVSLSGTIGIANDAWGAINLKMVAASVLVNGTTCPGGVDVVLTGAAPASLITSTGAACGRTGVVPLP